MVLRNACLHALVGLSACISLAQEHNSNHIDKACVPKIVEHVSKSRPTVHFRPGEKYVRIPIITFEILVSGEVSNAKIKRSSGVRDIDRYALEWVRSWRYNNRPGNCPVIENQAGVTIDFAAD